MMKKKDIIVLDFLFLILLNITGWAQQQGTPLDGFSQQFRMGAGILRIAEQGEIADTINVWGDLQNSGRFLVPRGTTLAEMISFAGGPVLFRTGDTVIDWSVVRLEVTITQRNAKNDTSATRFIVQYDNVLPAEFRNFQLENEDVLVVQVKRRRNWRDYLGVIAPIASTLTAILLIYERASTLSN